MDEKLVLSEKIGKLLLKKKKTVAIAESCTGGLLSSAITDVAGSSNYFGYGIISYSNEAKIEILGVRESIISQYGAVSKETAVEMAEGVRNLANSDYGLSTTGIAGPGGGTLTKPVGLVFVGFSTVDRKTWIKLNLKGSRHEIRHKTVLEALRFFLDELLKE
ncbi:MAG: Putative competence-damage inducible protein [Clostridia bacterium 41_269]|nr:MAG: Putative competence-damage inducible protein [Clostridia bacterium 41_269]